MIKEFVNFLYEYSCNITERKKAKEFGINLSEKEKKSILKSNINACKVFKKTYSNWNNCKYQYFVSDTLYQTKILTTLNDVNYNQYGFRHKYNYFSDKNYQNKFVNSFNFPNVVIRRINNSFYDSEYNYISKEEALRLLNNNREVVFKTSLGIGHGKGVKVVRSEDYNKSIDNYGKNYVVQTILKQNEFLAHFNSSSVNVLRITSLLLKGEVYIIGAILRIGAPGSFCDHLGFDSKKPLIVALNENGDLVGKAVSPDDGKVYDTIFDKKIEGTVPCFHQIIDSIKKEHMKFLHHGIIGWDITIDENDNPVCIEYNPIVPGIIQTQMACGPIFSKLTKDGNTIYDELIKTSN